MVKTSRKKGRSPQTKVPARKQERKKERREVLVRLDIIMEKQRPQSAQFGSLQFIAVWFRTVWFSSVRLGSVQDRKRRFVATFVSFLRSEIFNFNATESTMQKSDTLVEPH